jgi:hypothetical protein
MPEEIDTPTPRQVIADLKREKIMREMVYPKMVNDGRMKASVAAHRMACIDVAIAIIEAAPEAPAAEYGEQEHG